MKLYEVVRSPDLNRLGIKGVVKLGDVGEPRGGKELRIEGDGMGGAIIRGSGGSVILFGSHPGPWLGRPEGPFPHMFDIDGKTLADALDKTLPSANQGDELLEMDGVFFAVEPEPEPEPERDGADVFERLGLTSSEIFWTNFVLFEGLRREPLLSATRSSKGALISFEGAQALRSLTDMSPLFSKVAIGFGESRFFARLHRSTLSAKLQYRSVFDYRDILPPSDDRVDVEAKLPRVALLRVLENLPSTSRGKSPDIILRFQDHTLTVSPNHSATLPIDYVESRRPSSPAGDTSGRR